MLTFALAVFYLIITPGPGVLTTAGVGAGFGWAAGLRYVTGLFIGTNLVALAVVTGLWAVVDAAPWLRVALFAASTLYLLYLAGKIAFAGSKVGFIEARKAPGVLGGVLLQAINPKAYVVNTLLFTGFAFMPGALGTELALKFLIMNLIWVPIHLLWLGAGVVLHRLNLRPAIQSLINKLMAASMLLVVALAVWAQLG
ncbi:MAG: threonine/homoserine/homoserine lactone efflux protein [Paracoccaceae bacterium]|jgi:threonine/homoserine/homoserine lactone efflux protein